MHGSINMGTVSQSLPQIWKSAMDQQLHDRLNQIPDKILSAEFLSGQGLGNEIGFWIFDYQPEQELIVREYVDFLEGMLAKKHSHLKVVNINLLKCLVGYLDDRQFVEKAIQMQKHKGDDALMKALKARCTWTRSPLSDAKVRCRRTGHHVLLEGGLCVAFYGPITC